MKQKFDFDYWLAQAEAEPKETLEDFTKGISEYRTREIVDCNIIEVCVGTTGYKGGDTGHGGRTLFKLTNQASTDMRVSINGGELQEASSIVLAFGGDSELETFKKALRFAFEELERMQPEMSLWEHIKRAWKYKDLFWLKSYFRQR